MNFTRARGAAAVNPRQASGGSESVKAALREHAVLAEVAALAARLGARFGDGRSEASARRAGPQRSTHVSMVG
jgi:hypothetical protein